MSDSEDREKSDEENEDDDEDKSEEEDEVKSEEEEDDDEENEDDGDEDEEEEEDEDSKKKKKGRGKEKGKGKGKENDVDEFLSKARDVKVYETPRMVISSVSQELDSLSTRLSTIFSTFQTHAEKGVTASEYMDQPYGSYYRSMNHSQSQQAIPGSYPYGFQEKVMHPRPWTENKAIQCDDLPGYSPTRHSQEARRAVQEYKTRKLIESQSSRMLSSNYYQEPTSLDAKTQKYPAYPQYSSKVYPDQKLRQSNERLNTESGYKSRNYNQYEDNFNMGNSQQYQDGLRQSRSIKDLYKYKPRSYFNEHDANPVDRYNNQSKRYA